MNRFTVMLQVHFNPHNAMQITKFNATFIAYVQKVLVKKVPVWSMVPGQSQVEEEPGDRLYHIDYTIGFV